MKEYRFRIYKDSNWSEIVRVFNTDDDAHSYAKRLLKEYVADSVKIEIAIKKYFYIGEVSE